MANGCTTAEENVQQANSARASLEAINAAIETINAMNRQIALASEQQSSVSEEINRSIISISQESKSAATLSQQSMNTTTHLGQLAAELQQVVQQFKITSEESTPDRVTAVPGQEKRAA
jgi:methyl-accepting chemotaxis protein